MKLIFLSNKYIFAFSKYLFVELLKQIFIKI